MESLKGVAMFAIWLIGISCVIAAYLFAVSKKPLKQLDFFVLHPENIEEILREGPDKAGYCKLFVVDVEGEKHLVAYHFHVEEAELKLRKAFEALEVG